MDFGERLRRMRENAGLSARALAEKVGVSPSFIYQLERNEATPSFSTLKRIGAVLGTGVSVLTDDEFPEEWVVVRKGGRRRLVTGCDGVNIELFTFLGSRSKRMQACFVSLGPQASYPRENLVYGHERDDFVYVLEGSVEVLSGGKWYRLEPGDAAHFSIHSVEALRNADSSPAAALWVVSPSGV
ncbi:MAG: XRE family transcriptional regulator [Firmicutes bacterium]|jgi:transcriptional regulator with XRE-family HTH domain|nr:XRE family transcriptional regulator [Bacillota bacterium]MDH7496223.1 XRE family transcriptional regulator [Bacillota bacterium]